MLPSDLCTDAEFIRRVYLDLTGLPPQPDEVRAFLADSRPAAVKRDELVDKLVGSPEFVEHWTNKWADLLQVNRKFLGEKGAVAFRNWIRKAVAEQHALRQVRLRHPDRHRLEPATTRPPPTTRSCATRTPAMENTTQLFLAVRFNCNKCHDHPFERWTQDQYYQLAAFFAQVGRKEDPKFKGQKIGGTDVEGAKPLVEVISDAKAARSSTSRTGAVASPPFPVHAQRPGPAPRPAAASSWPTGSPRRRTPTSPRATSTACGATCSASGSSSRSTTSAPATRRPIPSCSIG